MDLREQSRRCLASKPEIAQRKILKDPRLDKIRLKMEPTARIGSVKVSKELRIRVNPAQFPVKEPLSRSFQLGNKHPAQPRPIHPRMVGGVERPHPFRLKPVTSQRNARTKSFRRSRRLQRGT
jgi:hypothetical protein